MKVRAIPATALDDSLIRRWRELQDSNDDLSNPCFSPEFTKIVASARNDVRVGIIEESGEVCGFLPFQRLAHGIGQPVGGIVSDYQGLICLPEFSGDPKELIKGCGLHIWDFDHLIASQRIFTPFHDEYEPSPVIDLSRGYSAYVAERRAAGTEQIKKCGNLLRRLELEVGPVTFLAQSTDREEMWKILRWKSRQYTRSGWDDLFAQGWARELVERVLTTANANFAGLFSALYAGDRLVAGHLGLRSRKVWHYWFPAYDPEFGKYSPGLLLLLKMAEHAQVLGLKRIDLGKGLSLYKRRLMNSAILLADGSVERPSLETLKRAVRKRGKEVLIKMGLFDPADKFLRELRSPGVGATAQESGASHDTATARVDPRERAVLR